MKTHGTCVRAVSYAALGALLTFGSRLIGAPLAPQDEQFSLQPAIAFGSTRDDPTVNPLLAAEIYLMDSDGTNPRRLTHNGDGEVLPALSPDGKKIVFDSNRLRAPDEPLNTSDLFLMDIDGSGETPLIRGSSATWSPDSKNIAFHASASGTGRPIKADPGAATSDSDIFVLNVDDVLNHTAEPRNITNNPQTIDDDPDWSPDGQKLVFTSHSVTDNHINSVTAEIYVMNADGTGTPTRLTFNTEEERAPAWSPDGSRVVFMCRRGVPPPGGVVPTFEICIMNADGSGQVQITSNSVADLTPNWSPDGTQIVFHRPVSGRLQLWIMNADGTALRQVTDTPGQNAFGNWGDVRVHAIPQGRSAEPRPAPATSSRVR